MQFDLIRGINAIIRGFLRLKNALQVVFYIFYKLQSGMIKRILQLSKKVFHKRAFRNLVPVL
jgi:hypothetical protein